MKHHQYVIVGAGPAGLQMGYFLGEAGRDYVILESEEQAGSFFAQYPRHRQLISLNKPYNWFTEPDFNLRYDWNSLLTHDNSLMFPDYTKKLYPAADTLVTYLNDFAKKFELNIQYKTRVTHISREAEGQRRFILTDQNGNQMSAQCLLMATGTVKPNIPKIEGEELIEGYEVHDIELSRFTNKRVAIIGHGNSAFEIAEHLSGEAATVQMYTSGRMIKHAWQSHFVGDLRSVNNNFVEMGQLKMPHVISGATITKVEKLEDGSLGAYYEDEVPHWAVPGTMHSYAVYDHIIRATGWKYIDPSIFAPEIVPEACSKAKFPVLNSIWESTVPDLFFIGAAMANNNRKSTPGFIHGFRYNVRTVSHLIQERYNDTPLPRDTYALTNVDELEALTQAILTKISTTSALYQMFSVLSETILFKDGKAEWFHELPVKHVMNRTEFIDNAEMLNITLELGFHNFPEGQDSLTFLHPNDPGGQGRCNAFIHPVFRRYSNGRLMDEMHMQSGLFVRYDEPNAVFATEWGMQRPHHQVYNFVNGIVKINPEMLVVNTFNTDGAKSGFTPYPADKVVDPKGLPMCIHTHNTDRKPELALYK